MKTAMIKFFLEYKVEGSDRVRTVTTIKETQEQAKNCVRNIYGCGVKVEFINIVNTNGLG